MSKSIKKYETDAPHFNFLHEDAEVLVLGTAHVSAQSVIDVETAFTDFKPDGVCVELCQPRYDALRDPDRWRKLDLSRLIKEKKLGLLASSLILSSFQKKIGENSGVKPGAEMIRAADLAEEGNLALFMADREVRATLLRAWHQVGFFSKMWLGSSLFASLLVREDISSEEIERMKQEDVLSDLFTALPARYSHIKKVIIDERDHYLSEKILRSIESLKKRAAGKSGERLRILAVVGAGHLQGVKASLEDGIRHDIKLLDELPPRRRLKNLLSWVGLSLTIILLGYYLGENNSREIGELLLFWSACRSIGAGVGALIARAHPLTIVVTAAVAPFSIFLLGTRLWMFSSLTELYFNKPQVEDFENIASDTDSVKGMLRSFYKNRVLKLFWIISMVSTGLTIGNLVFWSDFFRSLFKGSF